MADLIDRQAAIDAMEDIAQKCDIYLHCQPVENARYKLESLPAIDAEPVVRCRDCKFKVVTDDGEWYEQDVVCSYWATDGLTADDYCSYGERGIYKPDED